MLHFFATENPIHQILVPYNLGNHWVILALERKRPHECSIVSWDGGSISDIIPLPTWSARGMTFELLSLENDELEEQRAMGLLR